MQRHRRKGTGRESVRATIRTNRRCFDGAAKWISTIVASSGQHAKHLGGVAILCRADGRDSDWALATDDPKKQLGLSETAVADLSPVAKLSNLERLFLDGTQVKDLSPLASLTKLKTLFVRYAPVVDLMPLASLTNLEHLRIEGTSVSDEEVSNLQQALPNCKISR